MSPVLPVANIVFMCVSALVCAAIPIVLLIVFRKKGADVSPFFIGCAVFVIFALLIEGLINFAFSQSSTGKRLLENVWFYAVYGGLMAGLFEETGRFLAFKTVLKKLNGNDMNALMYGAGHGGIEAILLVGVSNAAYIVLLIMDAYGTLSGAVPAEASAQLAPVLQSLRDTPAPLFLVAILERCIAIASHIALSVIVWFGAKDPKKTWLFPAAVLLHALLDIALVIAVNLLALPTLAAEGVLFVLAVGIVLIALFVWKKNRKAESDDAPQAPAE